ncbi:Gfo/Idh/MocA family protein [Candidatus Laterigemmans baculatus]|uniref:Gfo/Idh/MocA family protein n=1 Tax=Candidatus Laterigemmans baculatus TaxID=2770505 RepID=UPI0013DA0738|nr:Gfo/Idh/MocA family oxidoreductase [Candidatus Laterigemmans baculatus]
MELEEIRFGVLGTGRITRRLVAELQQASGVRVTAIASREASRGRWYADQFGIPHAFGDYAELIRSSEVDAVYIALPPAMHAAWAIAAAAAGKHVLCEKPLATTLDETLRIDSACRKSGVCWLDATGWLHHPRTSRMAAAVGSGELGTLRHVSASVSFFEPFQSGDHRLEAALGGGCLLDLGWYALGMAVWAVGGQAPRKIFATGKRRGEVWDRVSAVCVFANGVSATINCGYDTATRKWMEIAGDDASIVCDDFTRPWPDRPTRFWIHDRTGAVRSESFTGNQEANMVAALVEELQGKSDLAPLRRQAVETARVLAAAAESLDEQAEILLEQPRSLLDAST